MTDETKSLDILRAEIDGIDTDLLTLLSKRTEVVRRIAGVKSDDNAIIRPGREAEVLRKILAAKPDGLSFAVVARIWRELISAYCQLQGMFSVAVCAPEKSVGYWDLARNHFGSGTPMTLHKSAKLVLQIITENPNIIGLLPLPKDRETDPWWRYLVAGSKNTLNIIGRLPFVDSPKESLEEIEAMIVANFSSEKSGKDCTWMVVEMNDEVSNDWMNGAIVNSGFKGRMLSSFKELEKIWLYLLEVEGFYCSNNLKIINFQKNLNGSNGVITLGSYAL